MSWKLSALMFSFSRIWAGTVIVNDPFNVAGKSDVIGNPLQFDAQSVHITAGGGALSLDIFTNFDNPNLYSFRDTGVRLDIGDVFFTVNGAYRYGIPLAYHNGPAGGPWGERLYAGHVYEIEDAKALLTARQALHDPMYVDYRPEEIVWMIDTGGVRDLTSGTPTVQVLRAAGNDGVNGPLYDIRVITSLPAGLFASGADTYGLSFATATCGNDMVKGTLEFGGLRAEGASSAVPEPGTCYLVIGAALVALGRLGFRRWR